jgi:hypothetical protein
MRSMMANRQGFERRLRREDLLLVPPFPQDMGILDWHRHTELMDSTYRWAMREVARLREAGHPALGVNGAAEAPLATAASVAP